MYHVCQHSSHSFLGLLNNACQLFSLYIINGLMAVNDGKGRLRKEIPAFCLKILSQHLSGIHIAWSLG
jgi:hypothetical protein